MAELVESLTETMAKKQAAKYDPALEADARSFLVGLFGGEAAFGDLVAKLSAGEKMQPLLKDGVLLCHAANKVCPGLVPRVNSSSLPFKQRENISGYLTGCEKLGFNSAELFETVDLFDDKDMMRVFNSLRVLKTYKEKYDPETLKERLSKATEKKAPVTAKPAVAVGSPAPRRVVTTRSSSSLASSSSPVASPTIQRRNPEAPPSVSSLEDDIAVANEFKYSVELERIACDWMGKVLDKDLATPSFIECIKSGVVLCELLNKIKPGTVTAKIHDSRIAYRQMENIGNYLKGCEALGMRQTDLFNTVDLFEEKNLHLVIKNIVVLGNTVQGKDYYSGPKIEDASKTKNLWSESLAMTDLSKEVDEDDLKETPPEHQEWVDWINSQLIRLEPGFAVPPVRNLTSNLRSGVVLMRLVEVLTGQCIHAWEKEPQYLWQYMNNASAVLRFITSITFEVVTVCKARDIVSKNTTAIIALLQILRDKFDLDFLFQKILSEELDDSEREIHRHLFISVPPSDTPSPMPRSPRGEDEGEEERVVVEEADKQPSQPGHQAAHQEEQKGKEKDEDEGANSTKAPTPCKFDEEQQQTDTMVSPGIQTQQQQQQQQEEGQQQPQEKIASPREIVKPQSPKKVTEEKDVQPTTPKSEAKQEEDEEDEEGQEEEEQDEEEEENEDEGGEKDKQDDKQTTEKTESKGIDVKQDLEKEERKKITEEEAAQKPKTKKKKKQKTESTTEDKKKKTKKTKKIKKKGSSEVRSRSKIRPSESASSPTTQSEIVVTLPSSMSSTDVQTKKTKKKTGSGSKAKARPKSLGEDQSKIIGQLLTTSEDKQALTGKKKKSKAGSGFVSGSSSALAVKKEKKRRKSFGPTTGKSIVVEEDPTAAAATTTAEKESSSKKGSAVKERKSRSKRGKPSSQKKAIVKKQQEEPPKVEDTTTANNENEEETKLPETKEEESKEKVAEESKATPSSPQSPLKQEEEEAKEKEQPPSLEEQKAPSHPQPQKSTESTVTAAASADSSNEGTPREDSPWVAAKPPVRVAKVLPTRATSLSDINAIKMERARNVVRKRVATEILTTEMSYVDSLQTLVNQVVVPLQKSAMRVLTETEHKNLFWNLDRILNVHEEFLVVLQQKLKGWSTETTIGDVFLYQTAFLEEYKEYMQGYNASLVLLRHLDKRKPAFKQVREAFELKQKTKTCLPLDAFMIMPIQRVPRYALLLRELHKYTNPLHPDYNLLDQAATHINRKLEVLNKGVDMEVASRAQKINSIEDSIEGEIIPGESLFHPDRKVLKEGPLKWQAPGETSKKQVYLFLFNDLLLCCLNKKKKDKDGTSFTILFTQRMKDIARINDDKVDSGLFVLEVNTGDKHLVQAKNKTEALLWISVLNMR